MKKVLKKDLLISKGTEFECIDGMSTEYVNGNFQAILDDGKDCTIRVTMEEYSEFFEEK